MTAAQRNVSELEQNYIREIFLHLLDDIRYAKDIFNPAYVHLMVPIKLKTTYQLNKIAEFATEHFCERIPFDMLASRSEADIQVAKAAALEQALKRLERGD